MYWIQCSFISNSSRSYGKFKSSFTNENNCSKWGEIFIKLCICFDTSIKRCCLFLVRVKHFIHAFCYSIIFMPLQVCCTSFVKNVLNFVHDRSFGIELECYACWNYRFEITNIWKSKWFSFLLFPFGNVMASSVGSLSVSISAWLFVYKRPVRWMKFSASCLWLSTSFYFCLAFLFLGLFISILFDIHLFELLAF